MSEIAVEKSISVKATPQAIWDEVVKVSEWPKWKPFVKKAAVAGGAELAKGAKLKMSLVVAGPVAVPLSVTITEFEPGRRLAWSGGAPGLVAAVHSFDFEAKGDETVVTSREVFKGLFVRVMALLVTKEDLEKLHQQWVEVIKAKLEGPAAAPPAEAHGHSH